MKKTLITFALAAALLSTSVGVYALPNTNNNSVYNDYNTQIGSTASETSDLVSDPTNINKRVEYTKETFLKENGSESLILESWNDPKTFNTRLDNIGKIDGKVNFYTSTYSKDMGKNIVMLKRDENGNVISGATEAVNQAGADYNTSLFSKNTFVAVREKYASLEWTSEGNTVDENGTTIKKVSRAFTNSNRKATDNNLNAVLQTQMKEIAYLDEATGLPIKVELYEADNNKMNLIETKVYEFKYIDTVGNIYDTSGINLTQLPQFNYDKNAVG